jgi:hypothetical protein
MVWGFIYVCFSSICCCKDLQRRCSKLESQRVGVVRISLLACGDIMGLAGDLNITKAHQHLLILSSREGAAS